MVDPKSTAPAPTALEEAPSYVIDVQWYRDRSKSLVHLTERRMCAECRQEHQQGHHSEADETALWQEQLGRLAKCCSTKPGYVTARTPVLEAVLRLLMAHGNQPRTAEQLCDELNQRWAQGESMRDIPLGILQTLLDRHQSSGIVKALEPGEAAPEAAPTSS
ncbi:MAG: hypothetical protein HY683_06680 [Chloroflexi bacterium]|nr:hypothetical protein [Chloroflexota bacterium]